MICLGARADEHVPTIRANGLDIRYDVHGAGPPLVMLHGATSLGREDFGPQIALFSKAFRLYVPDARGHGGAHGGGAAGFPCGLPGERLAPRLGWSRPPKVPP